MCWAVRSQVDPQDTSPFKTCVCYTSPRCPDDNLCSNFLTAYSTSLPLKGHAFIFFLHSERHAVTKTMTMSCINEVFSSYVHVREALGHVSAYRSKDMWPDAPQTKCICFLNASWSTLCTLFTLVFRAGQVWSDHPRRTLIPRVKRVFNPPHVSVYYFCFLVSFNYVPITLTKPNARNSTNLTPIQTQQMD